MSGASGGPYDGIGDVGGFERLVPFVDGRRPFFVTPETDLGKLGLDQARVDAGDADGCINEIDEHPFGERFDGELGGAVYIAAGIELVAGDRADIDHVAASATDHPGQDSPADIQQSLDIGVDHLVPALGITFIEFVESSAESGVVHQDIDCLPFIGQVLDGAVDLFLIADIELDQVSGDPELFGQSFQPLDPPGREDELCSGFGKSPGDSLTDSGGGAGYKNDLVLQVSHGGPFSIVCFRRR